MEHKDAVKKFRQRRAARLGFNALRRYDSVEEYRKRRAQRMVERYDDGDEETNGNNGGGGGHGNTRLPFGICQREGIEVDPKWTPRDAWAALEGKGISAGEEYAKLSGKKSGKATSSAKPVKTLKRRIGGKEVDCDLSCEKYGDRYFLNFKAEKDGKELKDDTAFNSKEDMLYFLKENGVEEFEVDGETVNPKEMELPRRLMKELDRTYGVMEGYGKVGIANQKGEFVAYGVTFGGKKRKLKEFKTQEEAMQYFKDRGVDESDVSTSKRKSTGPEWMRSEKKEYFEDNGTQYGKISMTQAGNGACVVEAVDAKNHTFRKTFRTKAEAMRYMKEQGVEKVKLNGKDYNPQDAEIPKTVAKYKGEEYQDVSMDVWTSYEGHKDPEDDYRKPKKVNIGVELRGKDLDGRTSSILRLPTLTEENCTDEKIGEYVRQAAEKLGVDTSVISKSAPKASDVLKRYRQEVAKEEKRVSDRKQWEKEHPEEAEKQRREREHFRRTGKGYYSDD